MGENSDNIDRLSNAVVKSIQGEKLKSKESSLLNQSKYAKQVIGEYFSDRSSESSAWADSADEKVGNLFARRYNPDIEAYRSRSKAAEESEGNISQPTTIDEVIKANEGKYTAYAAGLLEASYNDGREHNPTALEKTFDQFYTLGKEGRDFEQYASMEVADDNFTYEQRQNAFNAGVKAAEIGKRTKLAEISKITSDDIIVKDNEGNEISLSEVNTSPETIRLFKEAATYHNTEAANTFISGFNGTSSFASYRDAFKAFYSAGAGNTKISAQEFVENGEYAPLFKSIDKDTATAAFNYGKKFATAERNKAKATPKVTRKAKGEYKNFVGGSKEMDEVYTAVAKKLGIDIHKVQNVFAENGLEANAQFDPNLFRITISGDAMSEFTDFTHELGHVAEDFGDSKKAQLAKDAILNWYTEQYGDIEREDLIYSVMQQYGNISRAEAIDEVVNEAIAKLFSDEKNVQKFLDWLRNKSGYSEKERKTIIQRITDALKRIIDAIKEIIAGGELSEVAEEFAGMQQDKADEILKLFFETLDSAAENYKKAADSSNGKAKYSLSTEGRAKTSNDTVNKWVYDAEIFSREENKLFHEKISQIHQGSQAFEKNTKGEYMLPIENKIVFTDGDYNSPYITRIIEVMSDYATDFEDIRSAIYDEERGKSSHKESALYVENIAGKKGVYAYTSNIDIAYEWVTGRRKRGNRKSIIKNSGALQDGRRNASGSDQDIRRRANNEGKEVSGFGGVKYSLKQKGNANKIYNKDGFKMTGREIAMLDSAVMKKNVDLNFSDRVISVYSNNYFYVCENYDSGFYNVVSRLDPETQFDKIKAAKELMRNETFKVREYSDIYDKNNAKGWGDRRRHGNYSAIDDEYRQESKKSSGLYVGKTEHNQLGNSPKSTGNLEGKGKYSLGVTDLEKQNKSLLSQNKEYERIIADLKRQLKNPDMRHFVDFNKTRGLYAKMRSREKRKLSQ